METTPVQAQPQSLSDFLEERADSAQAGLESFERDAEAMPINNEARKTNLYKMSTKDEILPLYRIGERVRLTKTIRNDGTYPHARNGDTLVEAGAEGYVRKIGDFLQTIRIYEVNFIEEGMVFGCREAELESALEDDGYDEVAEELRWLKEHRAQRAAEKAAQSQEEGE
ncbi:nitrogen fixation protein NifZ [Sulfuricurvum sp.]|uniref:nitrogen fixation protein NifZ n=1 Tax=Sulfuricurvum sp. TaxID=2025608 RepID=UPI003C49FAF9